ncbi:MAG: cellulase family glycosylhydrolase [Muribaculaceae bacterium]|nr:cellulase family glycosylhydrolase [Muribaculaceae bacterium]
MKLKNLFFTFALLSIGLLSSCGEDHPSPSWGDSGGMTVKDELLLSNEGAQTLNIKASVKPTLTTDADWLHIGEVKNLTTGIYTVEIKAEPNVSGETRKAEITVVAGNEKSIVKVSQVSGDLVEVRSIDPNGILDAKGGKLSIKYVATGEPALNLPDWIKQDGTRSLDENILSFTYAPNNSGREREGLIVLAVGKSIANVTVRQGAANVAAISGKTAKEIAADMYAGINIGNTMECPGGEGDWSMPVNETYVTALANMGFNAVRIPCAWDAHAKDGVIDAAWLDRVDEVVGWVIGKGMYALVNTHWDNGWIEGDACKKGFDEAVNAKFASYWTQIATKLNHYDQRLLFSALNEPPVNEDANDGKGHTYTAAEKKANKERSIDAIMKYEQTMLDAVRATGGNNLDRILVMSVPNTNIEIAAEGYFQMPKDVVADRLMVEAHFYAPYNFNMMKTDESWGKAAWYWGKDNHVAGSDRNSTWGEEDYVRDQMQLMKKNFVDKGYPTILGEYCVCEDRSNIAGVDKEKHQASQLLWNREVTREAKNAGCVPFFWETGGDISRRDGSIIRSYQLDGLFLGASEGKYPF